MNLVFLALAVAAGLILSDYLIDRVLSGEFDPKPVEGADIDPRLIASGRLEWAVLIACSFPAIWIVWDFLTRGGFSLRLAGFGLVREDGRIAPRWRCAWRSAVTWAPLAGLLVATVWLDNRYPNPPWAHRAPFYLALALPFVYAALALVFPSKGPHDRLSGLRVVPR